MWPFAHRDRPLQLRVFGSFSPLSPPAIIHLNLRKKKKKEKKKSRTSCAPFALGTIPAGQTAASFSPLFPCSTMRRPCFLCSYEISTCSELINSSRRLPSPQRPRPRSRRREGGLRTFSRGAGDSFLACHGFWGGIWLTKWQKLK